MSENVQKWLCSGCDFLLGYVENGVTLRVKRKDLYIEITRAQKLVINCCRCGKANELKDDGRPAEVVPLQS